MPEPRLLDWIWGQDPEDFFPLWPWAEVPSDGDVMIAAKKKYCQDGLSVSYHSTGNEGLAIYFFLSSLDCFYCSCSWPYFRILLSNKWKPGRGLGPLPEGAAAQVSLPAWMLIRVPCPALATSSFPAFCCLLGSAGWAPLVLPAHSLFMGAHLASSWIWDLSASSCCPAQPSDIAGAQPRMEHPQPHYPAPLSHSDPSGQTQPLSLSIPTEPTQRGAAACFSMLGEHKRQCWQPGHSSRPWVMQFVSPAPFQVGWRFPKAAEVPLPQTLRDVLCWETLLCSHLFPLASDISCSLW